VDKGGRSCRSNMRVKPAWVEGVRAEADRLGISMADFVIVVVNEKLRPGNSSGSRAAARPRKAAREQVEGRRPRPRRAADRPAAGHA